MVLRSDVLLFIPFLPFGSDVAVYACSIGAASLVTGVDEPQPMSDALYAGRA